MPDIPTGVWFPVTEDLLLSIPSVLLRFVGQTVQVEVRVQGSVDQEGEYRAAEPEVSQFHVTGIQESPTVCRLVGHYHSQSGETALEIKLGDRFRTFTDPESEFIDQTDRRTIIRLQRN